MQMEKIRNGKNGHQTLAELETRLANFPRKPGRKPKELLELQEQIDNLKAQLEAPAPSRRKRKNRGEDYDAPEGEIVSSTFEGFEGEEFGGEVDEEEDEKPRRGRRAKGGNDDLDIELPVKKEVRGGKVVNISLPPIETQMLQVTIVGKTPLICHAWDPKSLRQMEDDQQGKAQGPKAARDPDAEFNAARYLDNKGRDCIPGVAIRKAMATAAGLLGKFRSKVNAAVFVLDDLIVLEYEGKSPVKRTDIVRIGPWGNKVATPRYRPAYHHWSATFKMEVDLTLLSVEQAINVLNRAGFSIGLCEWRPEKGGPYGRFSVSSVDDGSKSKGNGRARARA